MPRPLYRLLLLSLAGAAMAGAGAGCAHHPKSKSYNKMITEDNQDPTFRADPENAGETIKFVH